MATARISQGTPHHAAPRPVRVMVVDDNAEFRKGLIALLDTDGIEVVAEASGGKESLDLIGRIDADIVLMDVRMPLMDGVETTRRLKAVRPWIDVVALTAQEDQEVVRDMLVAGASGYVLKDSDGADIIHAIRQAARGGAVISPDVTPTVIEEMNEALKREQRRARELEEARDVLAERIERRHQLVARLGHELRTPITVIYGVAKTLSDGEPEMEEQSDLLEALVARSEALLRLVERFEAAVDAELVEAIDLEALAREVPDAAKRVNVVAEQSLPKIPLNPVLARRILEELIDNAIRFSPGDTQIEVWIGVVGSKILVKVMDRGAGIGPGDRDRVFEPLEQGESVDSRVHQGAGVGLSLARTAARALDGDVTLETSGPEGSTFVWTIPIEAGR
ncbi:MAG: response regulator [Actinomycetota bacterium]